jgi:twinkle protein
VTDDSSFIRKEPCPECGSRDNLARYTDGHAYCFGCGHYEPGDGSEPSTPKGRRMAGDLIQGGDITALSKRKITEDTCRKFGYRTARYNDSPVQVAPYYDPEGNLVAQKVRFPDKTFTTTGDFKSGGLFGQQLWGQGGKKIVITEGEIDAMSVSQVQGNKWPVVSIPNGAQGAKKSLAKHIDWLCSFDEVILMFDMDEPGRKATDDCVALFPPGKVKVATLSMKDPNELLVAGRGDEIVTAIWQAKSYRPDGIVSFKEIKEAARKPVELGLPWWSETLTKLTYGRRWGECYALGAGTGIGKTDMLTQQITHDVVELKQKVGLFFLEQQPVETAKRLAGKWAKKRFHIPDAGWNQEELDEALDQLDSGDLFLYDSFGATEWDRIESTIRYLVHSEGVRIFYLDHLTALAAAEENEREGLERIMERIGSLVKELNIILMLISHLATPEGKPHEEGGRVMIRHFKGSRAIGFWCHFMFGMERDQQHEDPAKRSITTFRIIKDRYTGNATGEVIYLGYDRETGLLHEVENPDENPFADESRDEF